MVPARKLSLGTPEPHVLICYRNFLAKSPDKFSHIGLGVNAVLCARVLGRMGYLAQPVGVWEAQDIRAALIKHPTATDCIIEALFIPVAAQLLLCQEFPHVRFLVRSHSQVGFIQVEPGAIALLRELIYLAEGSLNFAVAANSPRFADFVRDVYQYPMVTLPNLYDHDRPRTKTWRPPSGRTLRIASYGSLRLQKNHSTAVAAALEIARILGSDLEFHVSVGRSENGGSVLASIRNLIGDLSWAKLAEDPWVDWPRFRRQVGRMDLCIQLSVTETFNICTADACAEGVPTVCGEAIDWAPHRWIARIDDVLDAARVGVSLLSDPTAAADGLAALDRHQAAAARQWADYLGAAA